MPDWHYCKFDVTTSPVSPRILSRARFLSPFRAIAFPACEWCAHANGLDGCVWQVVLFIPNFIGKTSDARAVLKDTVSQFLGCSAAITTHLECRGC